MNIFKRIFKIGQAEAHSAIDKLEDPIKLTEQGIRDMKEDLDKSLKALAEVKALAIRAKDEAQSFSNQAEDYENKAMLLLKQAQKGELSAEEADRLATEALLKKENSIQQMNRAQGENEKFESSVANLDANIKTIRSNISKWENELKTLKARVKVSDATKSLNKQMANIDSTSTVSMLERMKEKVAMEEALAASYGEIAQESRSVDDDINKALESVDKHKASDALAAMKKKLGMDSGESEKEDES